MEVILLEKIRNLGELGEKINVKPGYSRNYLIPEGKAVAATKENIAKFEQMRAELEKKAANSLSEAQKRAEQLEKIAITITMIASDEGKLFGSVGPKEITGAFKKAGETIDKHEIVLPEGPIRIVGEHEIQLQLHTDVTITKKITVEAGK